MRYKKSSLFAISLFQLFCVVAQDVAKADSLRQLLPGAKHDSVVVRIHFDLADIFIFSLPDSAEVLVDKALQLAIENKNSLYIGQGYNYKGILATNRAHYLTAIEYYQDALRWYRSINDKAGCGLCANNIGVVYGYMQDHENAVRNYLEAYDLSLELGKIENAGLSMFNICSEYLELKQFDQAEKYLHVLEGLRAGNSSVISSAAILAQLFLEKEVTDSAEHYLDIAIAEFKAQPDDYMVTALNVQLAEVRIKQKRYGEAEFIIQKAMIFAQANEFNEIIVDLLEQKAILFEKQGKLDKALEVQKLYLTTKDSLDMLGDFNRVSELNMKYETEKRELEISRKNQQLQQKSSFLLLTLISLSGLVIIGLLGLYNLIKKRKLNHILRRQNSEIRKQRQKIISSINYAKRIQNSILMPEEELKTFFDDGFIYFRPKDIVSGDFYWFHRAGEKILIASIDCTGHGVPGAFMSLIANNKLRKVVDEIGIEDPAAILSKVNAEIIESLHQDLDYATTHDGMEMSLCVVDRHLRKVSFAGAHNGALLLEHDGFTEMKADNQSIGGSLSLKPIKAGSSLFRTVDYSYHEGALLYMFTDGFMDQFGGDQKKKLNKSKFKEVLEHLNTEGLTKAKEMCDRFLQDWRAGQPQLDDILLIGVRL